MRVISEFKGRYAFLSNFYREFDGNTAEHFFQAAKTFDAFERHEVLNAKTPAAAKRAGRKVTLRDDWDKVKDTVMLQTLRDKFYNDADLKAKLLATGDAHLIEGNYWHDQYWGDCNCEKHRDTPGQNKLGQLLMQVRSELNVEN